MNRTSATEIQEPMQEDLSIVVLDDQQDTALVIKRLLETEGYRIRVFTAALDALQGIEREMPDCVIFDLGMPIMDGFVFAEALRSRYSHDVVLIAITGLGNDSVLARKTLPLVDHYFKKPIDVEKLKRVLRASAS